MHVQWLLLFLAASLFQRLEIALLNVELFACLKRVTRSQNHKTNPQKFYIISNHHNTFLTIGQVILVAYCCLLCTFK